MTDLISRQAAIDAFEKELCDVREFAVGFVGAKRILESVPSVQPERKKARWILEPYSVENDTWAHRCGECLKFAMIGGGKPLFRYCPSCGAKMEVEE